MTPLAVGATLAGGGLAGLVSGLVGVGGGIVMVPVLYLLFARPEWSGIVVPPADQAVVAHATSLFVIVPTALSGTYAYHRRGLVEWRAAFPLAGPAALAALGGAQLAVRLPAEALKALFGIFLVLSGLHLLRRPPRLGRGVPSSGGLRMPLAALGGALAGLVTSLLGVGGGIVVIPILIYLLDLDLKKVAATSLAVVVFSSVAGVLSYAAGGAGGPGLPEGAFGYLYLPAGLALLPGAVGLAPVGARLNQRLGARSLRLLFSLVFVGVGLRITLSSFG